MIMDSGIMSTMEKSVRYFDFAKYGKENVKTCLDHFNDRGMCLTMHTEFVELMQGDSAQNMGLN